MSTARRALVSALSSRAAVRTAPAACVAATMRPPWKITCEAASVVVYVYFWPKSWLTISARAFLMTCW